MKILEPILTKDVPDRIRGKRPPNKQHIQILARAQKLSLTKTLPVECNNLEKAKLLYGALRVKIKKQELSLDVFRVKNIVYIQRISKEK